jgi:hypothetical protein
LPTPEGPEMMINLLKLMRGGFAKLAQ